MVQFVHKTEYTSAAYLTYAKRVTEDLWAKCAVIRKSPHLRSKLLKENN